MIDLAHKLCAKSIIRSFCQKNLKSKKELFIQLKITEKRDYPKNLFLEKACALCLSDTCDAYDCCVAVPSDHLSDRVFFF